ncbi:hypothetical protein [Acinetobacter sp.]|uniref:hypothetical protein n=1 Tax=Acinetobacter sp. TaxID=472 RepID=UPI0031E132CB
MMNKQLSFFLTCGGMLMASPYANADISVYSNENTKISANVNLALGAFSSGKNYIPNAENKRYSWQEGYIQYGLGFEQKLGQAGMLYGKANLVSAGTWGDGDAGGYTDGSERATKIEDAYIGWKSGKLFPDLGNDGLDLSFGRQSLCLGNGFLICADAPNLGNSPLMGSSFNRNGGGTYYLAGHRDFNETAVLKIASNKPLHGSIFTFKSNNRIQADARFTGANVAYTDKKGTLEFTYLHNNSIDSIYAKQVSPILENRNGMNVYSIRGDGDLGVKNANFAFEYAAQDKKQGKTENAWYVKTGYTFSEQKWKPSFFMRYSRFSENWDNLFIGAMQYGQWFQGEVAYNYAGPFNANTQIATLGVGISPLEKLSLGAIAYDFKTLKTANNVNYTGQELDIYGIWTVNSHITVSPVLGLYKPKYSNLNGGLQTGDNHLNVYSSLVLSASF